MIKDNISNNRKYREGLMRLLEIKDSQIRISILKQGVSAVDKGIHIGGAFSSVIPMVSLYYSGIMNYDVQDPTAIDKDLMVLSKGHAVATLASVYADVGYFPSEVLNNSRSHDSILNGHPGPILPGVHLATGPLGQGMMVAQGFALYSKNFSKRKVFAITGDGELQEGIVWETFMYAPKKHLDNFCVIVDKNNGQLDDYSKLHFSMDNIGNQLETFGWKVVEVDGTQYGQMVDALQDFVEGQSDGRPLVIISHTTKGFGSFSQEMNKHKISLKQDLFEQELALQQNLQRSRIEIYKKYISELSEEGLTDVVLALEEKRSDIYLPLNNKEIESYKAIVRTKKVPARNKKIKAQLDKLPSYNMSDSIMANQVIKDCMCVYATDERVFSVDSDLASTSGLNAGVGSVDKNRALNVGIAEANMMCIGEAVAALGGNAWVSTFCPFFNWQVMRRIGVSQQERLEAMQDSNSWLSEGHELDLTFVATAANLDTQVNGATHMGNDDNLLFSTIPGLKIIDVSCPNQLVSIIRWIMDGSKGLVYLRIMRSASNVLYPAGVSFEYGKAWRLAGNENAKAAIITSGRGTHEALATAKTLSAEGISISVYDMPTFDKEIVEYLCTKTNLPIIFAEQNNGYLWNNTSKFILDNSLKFDISRLVSVNLTRNDGSYKFIHSAKYDELTKSAGLDSTSLVKKVKEVLS